MEGIFKYLLIFLAMTIFYSCLNRNTENCNSNTNKMSTCKVNITDSGLPFRTQVILNREEKAISPMIRSLNSSKNLGEEAPILNYEFLESSLNSEDDIVRYTAIFIAGRCICENGILNNNITKMLELLISQPQLPSDIAVEVAMSLILRGKVNQGKNILKEQLTYHNGIGDQYKAAFYLAQTGDISGYPIFVEVLNNEIPHYRLLAMRHILAFVPFNGKTINNIEIDILGLFNDLIKDEDELVRSEIPFYLEELNVPNLKFILENMVKEDSSSLVRDAAQMVFERN